MTYTVTPEQMIVLQLIQSCETPVKSNQRVQKLIFLLDEKLKENFEIYNWKKYDYGPYSKQLQKDIRYLDNRDFIDKQTTPTLSGNTRIKYMTTHKTEPILSDFIETEPNFKPIVEEIEELVMEYDSKSTRQLVHLVYDSNPEYIENSVWRL